MRIAKADMNAAPYAHHCGCFETSKIAERLPASSDTVADTTEAGSRPRGCSYRLSVTRVQCTGMEGTTVKLRSPSAVPSAITRCFDLVVFPEERNVGVLK